MKQRLYNPQFFETHQLKNVSGVYQIRNIINDKIYIGSSKNLEYRYKSHFRALNRGNHENRYLQRAYNKYGKSNFIFEIIEFCKVDLIFEIEQYWINQYIDTLKCYNINKNASCPPSRTKEQGNTCHFSKEMREHLSKIQKQRYIDNPQLRQILSNNRKGKYKGTENCQSKPVICLETNQLYACLREAQENTGINHTCISACCRKKALQAGGFHWVYLQEYNKLTPQEIQNILNDCQRHSTKQVVCLETKEIFTSVTEAAKIFETTPSSITQVCKGFLKSIKGYRFVYKTMFDKMLQIDIENIVKKKIKKSKQACVCLETLHEYESLTVAAKQTNLCQKQLQACCNHKQKSVKGLHWVYKTEYDMLTDEDINKLIHSTRNIQGIKCKCLETNEVFISITQAAKALNICERQIKNSCKGEKAYTHGYHFEFVN